MYFPRLHFLLKRFVNIILLFALLVICGCTYRRIQSRQDVIDLMQAQIDEQLEKFVKSAKVEGHKHRRMALSWSDMRLKSWPEVMRAEVWHSFFLNDNVDELQEAIDSGMPIHNFYGFYGNNETGVGVAKPMGKTYRYECEAAPLLIDAIKSSATNCAMCLLRHGVNPKVCSSFGHNVFHACALLRGDAQERFLRLFITEYHMTNEINQQSVYGKTPLQCAINVGNLETVRLFVENGADYKAKYRRGAHIDDKQEFPLIFCSLHIESEEVFDYILSLTPPEDLWYGEGKSILSYMDLESTKSFLSYMGLEFKYGIGQSVKQMRFRKLAPLVWTDSASLLRHENIYVAKMKYHWGHCEDSISFLNGFDFPLDYLETALEYAKSHNYSRCASLLEAKVAELQLNRIWKMR